MSEIDRQLEEFLGLWRIFQNTPNERRIKEEFPKLDRLNPVEISIITIVYQKQDVILKEICTMLDMPKSTLTSTIDRLEKMNYINRTISKRDRRSYGLELTPEGYEIQNEQREFEKKAYSYILGALDTDNEREVFMDLLRKIVSNIY